MKLWTQSAANRPLAVGSYGQRARPPWVTLHSLRPGVRGPFPLHLRRERGDRGRERTTGLGRRLSRGAGGQQPLPERAPRGGHYFQQCQKCAPSSEGGGQGPCAASRRRDPYQALRGPGPPKRRMPKPRSGPTTELPGRQRPSMASSLIARARRGRCRTSPFPTAPLPLPSPPRLPR